MHIEIRRAVPADSERATELARLAKAHWGYPDDWMNAWDADLFIRPEDIERFETFFASIDDRVVGMCQLQESDGHAQLEHVWVDPVAHGKGVGRALVEHARSRATGVIAIVADPNAEAFYLHLGAHRVGEVAAPMPGAPARVLPLLEFVPPHTPPPPHEP